ncbi:hypothetical protein VNI00_016803 [Paramarasmius palmivorus]|uniref:Uncharacterized protein n=1 Tax=Paramarasmius palmivorus TaxID=297713 RepID=A0AAW0BC82_9AGAR
MIVRSPAELLSEMTGKYYSSLTSGEFTKDYPQWDKLEEIPIDIIGHLRYDTIYSLSLEPVMRPREDINDETWRSVDYHYSIYREKLPSDRKVLSDGLVRFSLKSYRAASFVLHNILRRKPQMYWLSQRARVVDCNEVAKVAEDHVILNPPEFLLRPVSVPLNHGTQPLYLFVYPLPVSVLETMSWTQSRTHFWSLNESGQPELPEEEYEQWGVPTLEPSIKGPILLSSWTEEIYDAMRDWQVVRGFDPTTSNFARHMGYPELEIVGEERVKSRFEDVTERANGKKSGHGRDLSR